MGGFLSFKSFAEFNTYLTFVLLGMSIMMVPAAITSAPGFVTEYYKYATGVPDAVAEKPFFWKNANTFYNVGTFVMQVITEVFCLTPVMRRLPLGIRLFTGLVIPFLEMILFVIVPAIRITSQDGAIAVLMVVSIMGGFSKALVDSTTNALVGPFPTKFMNGAQWGLTVVALFMSVIQCILKASMGRTFQDVLTQSRIYFGIGIAVQLIALGQMAIMSRNPYAQRYIAEFRVKANKKKGVVEGADATNPDRNELAERAASSGEPAEHDTAEGRVADELVAGLGTPQKGAKADPDRLEDEESDEVRAVSRADLDNAADADERVAHGNAAILRVTGDADKMVDIDQTGNLTSSDQMLRASLCSVFKRVWPMLVCAFTIFFTTLFLFPGLFFRIDFADNWFATIVVLLFNVGDFVARVALMFRALRPSPIAVICITAGRLLVIPLLVLCMRGFIRGHWMPYVLITALGLTNGYAGTMACVHCPRTPSLRLAGERSLAAMLSGVALMIGLAAGSNFALLLNLTIQ